MLPSDNKDKAVVTEINQKNAGKYSMPNNRVFYIIVL